MMVPAALSSLALFHHKDVFITLPVSLLYSLVYQLADVYFGDYFQMEMVVNVNVCACAVNSWTMYRYIHT